MNKPSIVFIDLDGTTLDGPAKKWYHKDPTEYTCKVLGELNKTIPVVVSTGRSANANTQRIVKKLGLDTFITWNGSEITRNGELLQKYVIEPKLGARLFKKLADSKMNIVLNSMPQKHSYTHNWFTRKLMTKYNENAKHYSEYQNDVLMQKVLVWNINPFSHKKLAKLNLELQKLFGDELEITLAGENNNIMEITAKGISKGTSEVWLCNYLGLDPKNAIHIGDSLNDASTKGKIGKLVAVKDAQEDLKKQADLILDWTCDESAVAKYLEQFLPNK
ncbi:HAD-IIB family hydrolase [Mycoplasmopsis glycophila]|uniref:COF family HAD hydrolase protein n=1 Tax=Mycoplasmopsis glycophila TaxID=171285 RepID=A0A449AUH2_9BACT|nr:HAD family hydrolase [Mycoplasmopsis glycophila]VEU70145.1 COF family HAD hydrolase protein [Mycoplasmopsis glycophila]